jgi:phosphoribosylformimino-5-aminoimidazole carboxamide ribotide isomerase
MLILPAIDLVEGRCVRLTQGDYAKEIEYSGDPVDIAKRFEASGAKWIHIVDLDGARLGQLQNSAVVENIARKTQLSIELGGGIRTLANAQCALELGVARVIVGSKVIQDPDAAAAIFGCLGESAVAGIDARNGKVAISGWKETSSLNVGDVCVWVEANGGKRIILTDIAKDGMLQGPNMDLLEEILSATSIPVIQSGGISSLEDIRALSDLKSRPVEGAIVGKALYEQRFDLAEAIEKFQLFSS